MTDKHPSRGFFAVDRRAWARVCSLGINPAVAYLVLACGSGRDNRTTRWSDHAIQKHTGISRGRTDKAMAELKTIGLIREDKGGKYPRYYIMPAQDVPGCEGYSVKRADPHSVPGANGGSTKKKAEPKADASPPDWIWLPNTIVTGAANETPPVQLLRGAQDLDALKLFVNLYHSHALGEDGGIHWRKIRREYSRKKVGERGALTVWGFQEGTVRAWPSAPFVAAHLTGRMEVIEAPDGSKGKQDTGWPVFWRALRLLLKTGLVEIVAHVVEADSDDAEIVHPFAYGNGEPGEQEIRDAAQEAALALLSEGQGQRVELEYDALLPFPAHCASVQLVGIARLRYRPQTKATAAWYAKQKQWASFGLHYRSVAAKNQAAA